MTYLLINNLLTSYICKYICLLHKTSARAPHTFQREQSDWNIFFCLIPFINFINYDAEFQFVVYIK